MADQLASPEDLASLIQQTDLDRATCELVIEAATAVIQAITGQRIVLVEDDEVEVPAPVGTSLWLPQRPIVAVSSVTLDGVALTEGTSSGAYRRALSGLWRECGWASRCGPTLATVVYSHGYAAGDQRLQLARSAVLSLAKGAFVNPDGVFSEKIDDYSVAYERSAAALEASPFLCTALRKQYGQKAGFVALA